MERSCRRRRKRRSASRKRLRPQDLAEVIDFDSRVVVLQNFTNSAPELEQAIQQDVGRRLDLALQRGLHRAEGSEEGRRQERRRDPPPGDRRALRRRRHVEPAAVRGGARSREAIGDRDLRHRPARAGRAGHDDARASRKPSSCCGSSRRKPAAARSSPTRSPSCAAIYGQISDELSSQYTVGYTSQNPQARRRVAPRRRPRRPAEPDGAHQAGLLRADAHVELIMNVVPAGALRGGARGVRVALRAAQSGGRPRRRRRCSSPARSSHTFVIGMQTMEVGHVPVAGRDVGDLDVRLAAGARLSLHRDDDRRAGDGRVHPAAARRAAGDSGASARRRGSRRRCCRVRCSASTCRRCCSPTRASRWRASSASPTCCCSRRSRRSTSASSTRGCRRCRCSTG